MRTRRLAPAVLVLALCVAAPASGADRCREGGSALSDAKAIAGVRGAIARQCPCPTFDGSTSAKTHPAFVRCAKAVIRDATDGTPVLGAFSLRRQCRNV